MRVIVVFYFLSISLAMSMSINAFAAGDPSIGRTKAILCIGCHGFDGNNSNPDYPILAGQGEGYITKQLTDFKTGKRVEEHMSSMVEAISLEDIPHLASFFSKQLRKVSTLTMAETTRKTDRDKGKQIYSNGIALKSITACATCHAIDGRGNAAAKFPVLYGQHGDYVSRMLKEFRIGRRHNDPTKIMRNLAISLTDDEIRALSYYISTMY